MKRKIFTGLIVVGILSISYGFVWQRAARKFEQKIIHLLDNFKNHQCDIKYDRLVVVGFPFKLIAKLKNPVFIKDKVGLALIKVDGNIRAQTSVFGFKKLNFSTHGVTHISYNIKAANSPLTLVTHQIEGEIDLWRKGLNRVASITLGHVDMTLEKTHIMAEKIVLENFQTHLPTHLKVQMTASNIMLGLKLHAPFDQRIDYLGLRARFDLPDPIEIKNLSTLLDALAHQGGTFELEETDIQWGNLNVHGNGTLTLDTAKQPLVSMMITLQGLDLALAQLVDLKFIKPYVPGIAQAVLLPFKVAGTPIDKLSTYKIPLSLQEGQLSVASFSLLKLPKIDWISALSFEKSLKSPAPAVSIGGN